MTRQQAREIVIKASQDLSKIPDGLFDEPYEGDIRESLERLSGFAGTGCLGDEQTETAS